MLHLYKYREYNIGSGLEAPFEITQDGIGEALGISRSYASLIVGRMGRDGLLRAGREMVVGRRGRSHRNIYTLSDKGISVCEGLLDNRDADAVLPRNINHCRSDSFDDLDERDRNVLGCLMVLGHDMEASQVPMGRGVPLMPVDAKGNIHIRPSVREHYIGRADPESLRIWHSMAADWCADHGRGVDERFVHLVRAGRNHEAMNLAEDHRYELMDRVDRDVADSLYALACRSKSEVISRTAAECYIRLKDPAMGMRSLDCVDDHDPCVRGAIKAEMLLAKGDAMGALDCALDSYRADTMTAFVLGRCMAANGRYSEAVIYLRKSRRCMYETGCLYRLEDVLKLEAESYLALGEKGVAAGLMESAAYATADDRAREHLLARAQTIRSEDLVGLEGIHVGNVQVPDVLYAPFEHREPFETEPPGEDGMLDAERLDDLGPEDACSSELHPLAVEEDLQLKRGLCVREVGRSDADLVESHPGVELADERDEHVEVGVLVDDYALDLGEFGQMRGIYGLLPEDPGYREGLLWRIGVL